MDTKSLHYNKTITKWDDALPLGNGDIGCLIWNRANKLRFTLDKGGIWDCSDPPENQENFTYEDMKRLVAEKNEKMLQEKYDDCYNKPTPTKLPAGKIILNLGTRKNIISDLDFNSAEANLKTGNITVKSFIHANENYGLIEVNKIGVKLKIDNPKFGKIKKHAIKFSSKGTTQSLKNLKYPDAEFFSETKNSINCTYFIQPTNDNRFYGIIAAKTEQNGKTLIAYTVNMGNNRNFVEESKKIVTNAIKKGYEKAFAEHKIWWAEYWQKSSISIPDKILEKGWYINNYLLASCSRKNHFPMPLQGVWTADNGSLPPWKGDYHNDLNTQLCYSHFFKANHLEEGSSFIDFLWNSMDVAKEFAKKFYGTEGICLPGVMTIDGKPLGGWPMYSLSPTHQIWLCQSFELYFQYTGDMKFLREKAWVYFEETAKCMTALLEEREGYYYLQVSSSPEIHDDEKESWLTPNSNYDLALLRYLYQTLIRFAGILGNGQENAWKKVLDKLPPLAVNEKNVLMLSPNESLKESHRHLSNAMAICPLRLMDYKTEKEIIDATVLDYEFLGTGMWVGFSFAWMSHLYSIQGNGEGAYEQLRIFWESFCSSNGFHLNGDFKKRGYTTFHYRPFTLEANMYAADALQEMLFQMHDGEIEVFAAIPKVWKEKEISFENFRGENGILVSAKWTPKQGTEIVLVSEKEQEVCIKINKYKKEKICLRSGEITHILLEQYM